ncbi:MAG: regulatory protein RecX [bacterium]|nr:regulatory protein RecX [bacterium]
MIHRALNFSYFYLKFRPRSKKEIVDYLHKKADRFSLTETIIDQAVISLEEQGLVDDTKFVEWFVEQRSRAKPKSEFALRQELFRFGIEKELLDEYFSEHEMPEEELALKALRPRWRRYENMDRKIRFQKVSQFLARRGFSFDIIKKTINFLEGE